MSDSKLIYNLLNQISCVSVEFYAKLLSPFQNVYDCGCHFLSLLSPCCRMSSQL